MISLGCQRRWSAAERPRPTPSPLAEILDAIADDRHAVDERDVDILVLFADDREEEDEPAAGPEGVAREADEVDCEVGDLVRLERGDV